MIRRGSLVTFDAEKAKQNPVYAGLAEKDLRFKVTAVVKRGKQVAAVVGSGILLPMTVLRQIPQKKGRNYQMA